MCATRKTPYDYNIKLQRSGPGTMLIETKSQIRRRPVECGIARVDVRERVRGRNREGEGEGVRKKERDRQ